VTGSDSERYGMLEVVLSFDCGRALTTLGRVIRGFLGARSTYLVRDDDSFSFPNHTT
jgi:hypothetical protein